MLFCKNRATTLAATSISMLSVHLFHLCVRNWFGFFNFCLKLLLYHFSLEKLLNIFLKTLWLRIGIVIIVFALFFICINFSCFNNDLSVLPSHLFKFSHLFFGLFSYFFLFYSLLILYDLVFFGLVLTPTHNIFLVFSQLLPLPSKPVFPSHILLIFWK